MILFLFSFLGLCIFIRKTFNIPETAVPAITIAVLLLILNFSALEHKLFFVSHLIKYSGIACSLYYLIKPVVDRLNKNLFSPRIFKGDQNFFQENKILFCIFLFFAFLYLVNINMHFNASDELHFWGLVSKILYYTNELPTQTTMIDFKDYPLACPLFHYFLYQCFGYFNEGIAYTGQAILIYAPIFFLALPIEIKEEYPKSLLKIGVLILFTSIMLNCINPNFLHFAYADVVLGMWFGSLLGGVYFSKSKPKQLAFLIPGLLLLPLIKQAGFSLALFVLAYALFKMLAQTKRIKIAKTIQETVALGLLLFFASVLLVAVQKSWILHYKSIAAEKTFAAIGLKPVNLFHDIFGSQVSKVFGHYLFFNLPHNNINRLHLPVIALVIIYFSLFLFLIFAVDDREKKALKHFLGVTLLGLLFYLIGLLELYLHSFSESEALKLASVGRYLGIYFIALFSVLITLWVYFRFNWQPKALVKIVGLGLPIFIFATLVFRHTGVSEEQARLKKIAHIIKKNVPHKGHPKIYYVYQSGPQGITENERALFYFYPFGVNRRCINLTLKAESKDPFVCEISPRQWQGVLKNFDYLFLDHINQKFVDEYGSLFKTPPPLNRPSFYRISHKNRSLENYKSVYNLL